MRRLAVIFTAVLAALALLPIPAAAQGFGIGPRFSFVKGSVATGADSTQFVGGTIRMRSSPHAVIELAGDYRMYRSDDLTTRVRETPIQASLLLFPTRGVFSPYVLGGIGIYTRMYDQLGVAGNIIDTTRDRKTGWHLGVGAEIKINPHTALYGDYRLRFVKFGTPDDGSDPINVPGFDKLKLSHQGSMWTGGIAFYF